MGLDRSVVSKIVSNVQMHNTNNVDKRSTLKPEDYPAVSEIISNTKSCNTDIDVKTTDKRRKLTDKDRRLAVDCGKKGEEGRRY